MRYREGHKEETRRRIIAAASKRFRKEGESVGVAELMADAGLTHGGFYAHFDSKEDVLREAVAASFASTIGGLERLVRKADDGLEAIIRVYLSEKHRDLPQEGCAASSLAAEIARHPRRTRQVFADCVKNLENVIAAQLPDSDPAAQRRRSTAILSLLMGALQLARAEPDARRSKEMLESGIEAALSLGRSGHS